MRELKSSDKNLNVKKLYETLGKILSAKYNREIIFEVVEINCTSSKE